MTRALSYVLIGGIIFALGAGAASFINLEKEGVKPNTVELSDQPTEETQSELQKPFDSVDISDPYLIRNYIIEYPKFDVSQLWRKLGIENEFNGIWVKDENTPFFESCDNCEVEMFQFDLSGGPNEVRILKITDGLPQNCRYLIFGADTAHGKYKLIGHIDHNLGKYEMPWHYFVMSGGNGYMVVQVQTASGTGIAQYKGRLFAIKNGKLNELLQFPAKGHFSGTTTDPACEFTGKIVDIVKESTNYRITFDINAKYTIFDRRTEKFKKWKREKRAVFIKGNTATPAKLNPNLSTLTQEEIDGIYSLYRDKEVFKYNRKELNSAGWKPLN